MPGAYIGIMTYAPSDEQKAHAKYDLLLADIELRLEQIHRTRQERHLAPWQVAFAGLTSGAAIFAAGAAFMKLFG